MHSMYGGMFAHVCCHILSYYLRATSVGEEIDTIKLFSHHAHYVCAIVADTWALHTSTSSRPVLNSRQRQNSDDRDDFCFFIRFSSLVPFGPMLPAA